MGHDVVGHQFHGAPRERGVHPIMAGVEERSEGPDGVSGMDDLLDDLIDGSGDDALAKQGRDVCGW